MVFPWYLKQKNVVESSIAETKYIAVTTAVWQAIWLHRILSELRHEQKDCTKNVMFHGRREPFFSHHMPVNLVSFLCIKLLNCTPSELNLPCWGSLGLNPTLNPSALISIKPFNVLFVVMGTLGSQCNLYFGCLLCTLTILNNHIKAKVEWR